MCFYGKRGIVTILILVDGFLQYINSGAKIIAKKVTILILVDGFLQYNVFKCPLSSKKSQSLF